MSNSSNHLRAIPRTLVILLIFAWAALFSTQSRAVAIPVTTIHSFNATSVGAYPSELGHFVLASDGNYYGTTRQGGANNLGTIYRLSTTGAVTVIHAFTNNGDGYDPDSSVIQGSDGKLYGTAYQGGQYNAGEIFKLNLDGTAFTTVYAFHNSTTDGGSPPGTVTLAADGFLYGTTFYGGANNHGTIYKVKSDGSNFTDIHDFNVNTDGDYSDYPLTIKGTTIYGTADNGGPSGGGTIFKLNTNGTGFAVVHAFTPNTDGNSPNNVLVGLDGKLYAETYNGGSTGYGDIVKVNSDGTGFAVILTLDNTNTGRIFLDTLLQQDSSGYLYAATVTGGTINGLGGNGTILKLKTDGSSLKILHVFANNSSEGNGVTGNITLTSNGTIIATKQNGATLNQGSIVSVGTNGKNFKLVYDFGAGYHDGFNTYSGLTLGPDGAYYGVTYQGGRYNNGTVFRITSDGTETVIHDFSNTGLEGRLPLSGVVLSSDGLLYGTTGYGGTYDGGTVFSITPSGTINTIFDFGGSGGSYLPGTVVEAADGNLYGTTYRGGQYNLGTIFRLTKTGYETVLHSFTGAKDGKYPNDGLIIGTDGNFYGTAQQGGDPLVNQNQGTIYSFTQAGVFKTIHIFSGNDGYYPYAGVIQGLDGKLYGTTNSGGSTNNGTIYSLNTSGSNFTVVHTFVASTDGANPEHGALVYGSDKKIYGTGQNNGPSGYGTAFSVLPNGGSFTVLASFGNTGMTGSNPRARLLEGPDGNIYGTTFYNGFEAFPGTSLGGTVFKIGTTLPIINKFSPVHGSAGTVVTLTGVNFNKTSSVKFGGISATFTVVSPTVITATVPAGTTTNAISVKTPYGANTTTTTFAVP